jgi:hypothetical protein
VDLQQKTIEKLVSKLISLSTQLERSLEITKQELSIIGKSYTYIPFFQPAQKKTAHTHKTPFLPPSVFLSLSLSLSHSSLYSIIFLFELTLWKTNPRLHVITDQEIQQELIKQEELFQTECRQISEKFLRWARGGGSGSGQSKKDSSKSKNRNKDENKNRKKQNRSSRAGGGGEGGNKGKGKNTTTTTATSMTKKKPTTNSKSGGGGGSWKGKGIMSNSTGSISDEDIQDGDSQEKVDAVEEQGRRKKRKTG